MTDLLLEFWMILAKSGLILLSAWLVSFLLRRRSPLMENYLWRATFVALLLLPLLSLKLSWPGLQIPIASPETQSIPSLNLPTEETSRSGGILPPAIASSGGETPIAEFTKKQLTSSHLAQIGASVWLIGFVALLIRFLGAHLVRLRARKKAAPVSDPLVQECQQIIRFSGRLDLRKYSHAPTPMGWGLRQAVILVPDDFENWEPKDRRHVLLHEMAHIVRWDTVFRLLAEVGRCLYWLNPLVWIALRRLRASEELATDAFVIAAGGDQASYAELLLHQARHHSSQSRLFDSVAAGMARKHTVSRRIEWILSDEDKSFPKLRRWLGLLLAVFVWLATVSGVQMVEAETEKKPPTEKRDAPNRSEELFTQVYTVEASMLFHGLPASATAQQAIWPDKSPPEGWTAIFNHSTSQLIVRAPKSEHARIAKLRIFAETGYQLTVTAFEVPKDDAKKMQSLSGGEKAYQKLSEGIKSGAADIQFLSRLNLQLRPDKSRGARITGSSQSQIRATLKPGNSNDKVHLELGFAHQFPGEESVTHSLSEAATLTMSEQTFLGATSSQIEENQIVVFVRVTAQEKM